MSLMVIFLRIRGKVAVGFLAGVHNMWVTGGPRLETCGMILNKNKKLVLLSEKKFMKTCSIGPNSLDAE